MSWQHVSSPHEPGAAVGLTTVSEAFVTPLRRGPLRTTAGPRSWMTGAVHDERGRLVRESLRGWHGDRQAPAPADPPQIVPDDCRRLTGRWIYSGHWTRHFGHFIVEVLTNLWPDSAEVGASGILAHRSFRGNVPTGSGKGTGLLPAQLASWQKDLLDLAGYGGLKVRIVRARPVRVEELVVPGRPVLLKSWVQQPGVDVWRRVAAAVPAATGPTGSRVFLSRARHHAALRAEDPGSVRTSPEWEQLIEARCAEAGFVVVHPEELPVADQINLVKGADVVAGLSGSALHLSAFAPEGTRVLVLGDERHPRQPMPAQVTIDAARGHRVAFAPYQDAERLTAALATL